MAITTMLLAVVIKDRWRWPLVTLRASVDQIPHRPDYGDDTNHNGDDY